MADGLRAIIDRVEFRATLEDQFDAERIGRGLRALAHGDVERIRGEAGDKRDGIFVLCESRAAGHADRRESGQRNR
jgi:hypothetical protein